MFGLLPDLTPRDSHSIWYTSSRNPIAQAALLEAHEQRYAHENGQQQQQQQQHGSNSRRAGQLLIERSALARLRVDEQHMDRRRLNVQNFGSGWLRPPGVPKTLHQMREEQKEQAEHAEAMRREQLVQELAEAEAAGQDVLEDGGDLGADLDAEEEEEEVRDLDDEIPDAEESFGFDGGDDDDSDGGLSGMTSTAEDASEDDDDDDDDDGGEGGLSPAVAGARQVGGEDERDNLVEARMRMADDAFRQAMARGDGGGGEEIYGGEELEAEGGGHLLDEEDLLAPGEGEDDLGMGMDMDADLDDDIPEAGELSGVYEHTDSEVDLTSSVRGPSSDEEDEDEEEEEEEDISFPPRAAPLLRAPLSPTRGRGGAPRSSMDLSGLLSAESSMMDSSMMQSSPNVRAQRR
ncbi:uncharacterized protein CTRU02_203471 [Colletotrichum truncatum]|uniref:Uncharacterized protein n=1 Tax=Colletotrichum truncatum TaxID=5467 RepID=A0ACC3Z9B3_COLTU|nr:uncharacterized protein CTRU02_05853 [Colletotrichum truncatum]KAF6793598.1 hypothetical protein CTRU02_05853 [Colletotrichum truncatum]